MSKGWFTAPKLIGRLAGRRSGLLILLIGGIAGAAALLERRAGVDLHSTLVPGDPVPAYTAESLDGTQVSIADYQGRVVLLNFWATWCSSCMDQFPEMQLLKDELGERGLEIISVNLDEQDRDGVQELWDGRGYRWLNLFDDPAHVEDVFRWGERYPKTLLVNRDGTVGVWWQGRLDLTLPDNRVLIDEAISGRIVWNPGI